MEIGRRRIQPGIDDAVRKGLLGEVKYLPEWVLMDTNGVAIFDEVTRLPEFYLAPGLHELSSLYHKAIAGNLRAESKRWNVIHWIDHPLFDLSLVRELAHAGTVFDYYPVSHSAVNAGGVQNELGRLGAQVFVKEATPDFSDAFDELSLNGNPTLFLVGPAADGYELNDLAITLKAVSLRSGKRDRVLLNLDLMKSPAVIEKAYYDYKGVNTLYHKNALIRMNREMGANFDPQQFEYWPIYDAVTGTCRRYLVSQTEQVVKFSRQGFQIAFNSWETISVGLSQKYDNEMIHDLLEMSGMDMERSLGDHRQLCTLLMLRSIRM